VSDNADRIEQAKQRGTLPYFLKDNKEYVEAARVSANYAPATPIRTKRENKTKNDIDIEKTITVHKGAEMTFEEANELRGNPCYGNGIQYSHNCQSCVVANELRRRGFDVQAFGKTNDVNSIPHRLSTDTELAWVDKNGKKPQSNQAGGFYFDNYRMKNKTIAVMKNEVNDLTEEVGRYNMKIVWKKTYGDGGHIITVERMPGGDLRFYDPQSGKTVDFFDDWAKKIKLSYGAKILRVDNLDINTKIINGIAKKS
jgi:hypothetical protein